MDAEEWTERGAEYVRKNEHEKALQAFEKALDLNPEFAPAWTGKGNALNNLGRHEEALRAFEQALDLNPEFAPAWAGKGIELDVVGRPEEALRASKQALDLNPELTDAWYVKGLALDDLGCPEEALQAFKQALDLNPELVPAWNGKGNALNNLDRSEEALRAFEQALDLNPEVAPAWLGKGNALDDLDRHEEALQAYEQALDLNPELVPAWNGKGNALHNLSRPEEALQAYEQALNLDPELAPTWDNKGHLLSDKLEKPVEARQSFLRVVHLADHASNPKAQQDALENIPSIIDHFQKTGSAPLLIVSLVERHELLDVYLREPRAIRRAYERAAPYRLLEHYFRSSTEPELKKREHSLLGLAAFYLGDPFLAQRHFGRLDTLDDEDLLGAFFYTRTHQEYARDEDANIIIDVSREHAGRLLRRAQQGHEIDPRQLYYAGQLFASGSDPQLFQAQKCFEAAAHRRFLPAMYMRAWTIRELEGTGDAHDSAVEAVLEEEEKRNGSDKEAEGYLQGQLPELSSSPEKDLLEAGSISEEEASAAVDAIEQLLWHRAHQAEIIDAIRGVQDWLGRNEEQSKAQKFDLPEVHQRSPELDEWIANRQHVNVLRQRLEEQAEDVDLEALRDRLRDRTSVPEGWLESDQTPPEELEGWLGQRIYDDENGAHLQSHQELILYFGLEGQISARVALALSTYLLATNRSSIGEFDTEDTAEALVGGLIGTGGNELLQAAGVRVALLGGFSLNAAYSLAATFIVKIVKRVLESAEERPAYPDFRKEFDKALEGQPDETYGMIRRVLKQIEFRQASPTT